MKTVKLAVLAALVMLAGCTKEGESGPDQSQKGMISVSLRGGSVSGGQVPISENMDPIVDNVRILVFNKGGDIDVNKKFATAELQNSTISTATRVGKDKKVVIVANATGRLDADLSMVLFYKDLEKLTLNPIITTNPESFDKVLVGEFSYNQDEVRFFKNLSLTRAYAKFVVYLFRSNDKTDPDKPVTAEVKVQKIEFLNMNKKAAPLLSSSYQNFWTNFDKSGLFTYTVDRSTSPIELKVGDKGADGISAFEYDTDHDRLTDRKIAPVIMYMPYEQLTYIERGSRNEDFKDFAPRIVVHATYNGVGTRYFIPRDGSGDYKYGIKRNNQYYFFGKVGGFGDETDGIIVTTAIVDWDHCPIDYTAAPSFVDKAEVFVQSFDKSGSLINEQKTDERPVQVARGQKVKVVLKVVSEEAPTLWVASLSDALNFRFDRDDSGKTIDGGKVGEEQTLVISPISSKAKNTFLTLQAGENPVLNQKDNTPFKLEIKCAK